ncbi:outer membrane beta-barrel protein [Acidiphilium sp. AL]|uniref:outer membrane beta-barrel protein n=1 Tax=Acidiphilium sp. AL TaxID=2871704 RepID=UPI0021CB2D17|nr:outer membrane beta-barrel protein [Acidiphilium sp. AL]MCU4161473.1 outer membrane beta-barrel protein [Acidiphilium sp. AL]
MRFLIGAGLTTILLAASQSSYALGGGGIGNNVPSSTFEVHGLGLLNGQWTVQGGLDAFGSILNNPTSNAGINGEPNTGLIGNSGSFSVGEAVVMIHKATGMFHFTYWGGNWQTPAMGITSNCPGCGFNSIARFGSHANPSSPPTFKWWMTLQPSKYWSISAGEMPSLEGVEIGFNFMNPTFFVSDLNNMQATPAYGPQLNFFYGPTTLNLQWSDSYHTGFHNVLSWLLTENLNKSGTDNVIFFGHENVSHTPLNRGPGGPEINSTLFGLGAQWVTGPWTFVPEIEYQYLPKQAITPGMLSDVGLNPADTPRKTYYNFATMMDVTYQMTKRWSFTVQPQYIFQNGDKNDPNAYLYGNWLQFGAGSNFVSGGIAPGTFSPGTSMTGLQVNATWQKQNLFFQPTLAFTHLAGFTPGTGYGVHGRAANQVVGILEFGILLGKL